MGPNRTYPHIYGWNDGLTKACRFLAARHRGSNLREVRAAATSNAAGTPRCFRRRTKNVSSLRTLGRLRELVQSKVNAEIWPRLQQFGSSLPLKRLGRSRKVVNLDFAVFAGRLRNVADGYGKLRGQRDFSHGLVARGRHPRSSHGRLLESKVPLQRSGRLRRLARGDGTFRAVSGRSARLREVAVAKRLRSVVPSEELLGRVKRAATSRSEQLSVTAELICRDPDGRRVRATLRTNTTDRNR